MKGVIMKSVKSLLGVTLLEVMLVLAIAAMIIVMSVRYYQSASSAQQANNVLQQVQGIVSAADSLAQAKGAYSNITNTTLEPLLPTGGLVTPWGEPITVTTSSDTTFKIQLGTAIPSGVCPLLFSKLSTNNHFSISGATPDPSNCSASGPTSSTSITYTSNP
jgi:type II secretory pathway pseudopilin PulG